MLLVAFVLNLFKILSEESVAYSVLNITGGGLLTFYAYDLGSIPFLILEAIWTIFATYKLITICNK